MKALLHRLWQSRSSTERTVIVALALVLVVALYVWFALAATRARGPLVASVTTLRAQAVRLDQQAMQYEQLRNAPRPPAPQSDVRALVQAQASAAGLSLTRVDAVDANQARATFAAVAYADWLAWVASLQAQNVRLDACRIEALPSPGLVTATATFVRAVSR